MRKNILVLLLAALLALSMTACGGKEPPVENKSPETAEPAQSPAPEQTAPETEVIGRGDLETEEQPEIGSRPADLEEEPETGSRPADTTQKPESKPVEKPTEKPAEKPEDSQSRPAPHADLAAFYETLAAGEDWPDMMLAEGEVLDAFYPGLSEITTNQCLVYTAMISATVGEIALVEVQNGDDVQKVKDIFQARIDYQVGDEENPGGAWYPETIEGWKNGSRIVSNGNFVMLAATYEKSDDIAASFNALFQ